MKLQASIPILLCLLLLGVAGWPAAALGEPAYVTDQLRLGFHRAPDTSDQPFRMLTSGEQVEVLERNRFYARVRAADGTEGWVKAGFLMSDKPAVLRVAEVEAKQSELDEELARIAAERAASNQQIADLETELQTARGRLGEVQTENLRLEDENQTFRQRFATPAVPLSWTLGGALFTLLAGFVLGLWWVDYRSRKRHGGIRVY